MTVVIRQAEEIALKLSPSDKLLLIERLMRSLDRPDTALNQEWKHEV